jgi:putative addiction module component (TIGR02574 family)
MAPPRAAALPMPAVDDDEELTEAAHGEAWDAELDRRIADVREGRVQCKPADQVTAEIRAHLAARRVARAAAG